MKKLLLPVLLFLLATSACKKDDSDDESLSLIVTHTSGFSATLPATVSFTANAPGAEMVTWDFGDGSTAVGMSTQHNFTSYGCFQVKATATKGGSSVSETVDVAVSFHRRVVLNVIECLQVPAFKPGGIDWDPDDMPDLTYRLIFPGDTIFETNSVISNSETGTFNVIPPRGTYDFEQDTKIEIYDKDTGNNPDREKMGVVPFKFCTVVPDSTVYADSVIVNSGSLRLKLKFTFLF